MKTHCERPYQSMITTAGTVRHLPEHTTERHVRRLAHELARAALDLDARMRAGLVPPRAWQPAEQAHGPHEPAAASNPEEDTRDDAPDDAQAPIPVFYRLPAADLDEGMSTDDGQDIISVDVSDDRVFAEVYTPRSDDPQQETENRAETECRIYRPNQLVGMATFPDTEIDGSEADNAQPHPPLDSPRRLIPDRPEARPRRHANTRAERPTIMCTDATCTHPVRPRPAARGPRQECQPLGAFPAT